MLGPGETRQINSLLRGAYIIVGQRENSHIYKYDYYYQGGKHRMMHCNEQLHCLFK